jgi:HK97 family phage major capsid protein
MTDQVQKKTVEDLMPLVNGIREKLETSASKAEVEEMKSKMAAEIDARHEKHLAEFEERAAKRLSDSLEEFQTKLNRANGTGADKVDAQKELHKTAFLKKLTGRDLTPEEHKAVSTDIAEQGGALLMPPTMAQQIIEYQYEVGNIMQLADLEDVPGDSYVQVRETSAGNDYNWTGERASRNNTDQSEVVNDSAKLKEIESYPKTTERALLFSLVNVESWLVGKAQKALGYGANKAFVDGDDVKQPEGILTNSDILTITQKTTAGANDTTISNLDYLQKMAIDSDNNGLLEYYQPNATWVMKSSTLYTLCTLKKGDGTYILPPATNRGQLPPLFGHSISLHPNMEAATTGLTPVVLGDFRAGYKVVRHNQIRVTRLADSGTVPYVYFRVQQYIDGFVQNPQAFVKLVIA